ncbi:hypothetical protein FA95DRAFT_694453 [Auriscalpium vulgare]|uniref:Uncharacterized protein n=1 Tax=Auriscalpium vulgare TaxID=40419 RepID=A0ACB8RC25_9AGAM|nr:hypothetical protein FA95DRAFT_694453 [Auriscalpium vulgare]
MCSGTRTHRGFVAVRNEALRNDAPARATRALRSRRHQFVSQHHPCIVALVTSVGSQIAFVDALWPYDPSWTESLRRARSARGSPRSPPKPPSPNCNAPNPLARYASIDLTAPKMKTGGVCV